MNNFEIEPYQISKYWPIIVFWPTLLGFIGFYFYSAKFGISYPKLELSTIIGLGIFNLLIFILIYDPFRNKLSRPVYALLIFIFLALLITNPNRLMSIIFVILFLRGLFLYLKKITIKQNKNLKGKQGKIQKEKISFSHLRIKPHKREIIKSVIDLFLVIIMLIGFFSGNEKLAKTYLGILLLSLFISEFKKNLRRNYLKILSISLFVPVITSYYAYDKLDYTIFGLSNEKGVIDQKNKQSIKGTLVYKSPNMVYLNTDSNNLEIPLSRINKISKIEREKKDSLGIDFFLD